MHLRIYCLELFFKVNLLSVHSLGHPLKLPDYHGAKLKFLVQFLGWRLHGPRSSLRNFGSFARNNVDYLEEVWSKG